MTPKICMVLGTTHSGKTWAAGYLAKRIRRPLVIIVSIQRDPSYLAHIDPRRTRFAGVHSPAPDVTAELLRSTRRQGKRYLYFSVYDLTPAESQQFIRSLVCAVKQVGDLALLIDEAHLFCGPGDAPDELIGFTRGARHWGVDLVFVTHGYKDISIGIRRVVTYLVLFRITDGHDLDVIERELHLRRDLRETIASLPDRRHVFVNRGLGDKGIFAPTTLRG